MQEASVIHLICMLGEFVQFMYVCNLWKHCLSEAENSVQDILHQSVSQYKGTSRVVGRNIITIMEMPVDGNLLWTWPTMRCIACQARIGRLKYDKNANVFCMWSAWHYTTPWWAYEDIFANITRRLMPFETHAHWFIVATFLSGFASIIQICASKLALQQLYVLSWGPFTNIV